MVRAFTTRLARTAGWVATATALATLGTPAIHAAPPAHAPTRPIFDSPAETACPLESSLENRFIHAVGASDVFNGEQTSDSQYHVRTNRPPRVSTFHDEPPADSLSLHFGTWNGTVNVAAHLPDNPGTVLSPTLPSVAPAYEPRDETLPAGLALVPDIPVIAFLLTGWVLLFLRRQNLFA